MDEPINYNMSMFDAARIHHLWVKDNGFGDKLLPGILKLANKVSWIYVNPGSDKATIPLGQQLADIILRAMDLAEQEGININYEIVSKMINNHADDNIKNRSK